MHYYIETKASYRGWHFAVLYIPYEASAISTLYRKIQKELRKAREALRVRTDYKMVLVNNRVVSGLWIYQDAMFMALSG